MAPPLACLRQGEEEWRDVFERLCERFPMFDPHRVAEVLRVNGGHAGQAASALRDMTGTAMRPVDPDDAEHVRTLLSSQVMFSHACKEHFRRFDINGDGCLQWDEIVLLVNALYDDFGLQAPREGGLKAFFQATDTNGDGVLSEQEFQHFFEMFLRYAFFDVVNHQQVQRQQRQQELSDMDQPQPSEATKAPKEPESSPQRRERERDRDRDRDRERRREEKAERERRRTPQAAAADSPEGPRPSGAQGGASASLGCYRCLAADGVAFRGAPDFGAARSSSVIKQGQKVQVQEAWLRTPYGWLPLASERGEASFEPVAGGNARERGASEPKLRRSNSKGSTSAAMLPSTTGAAEEGPGPGPPPLESSPKAGRSKSRHAGGEAGEEPPRRSEKLPSASPPRAARGGAQSGLQPGEEDWQGLFERLRQRFPMASVDDVAQALRDSGGHAGQAATKLRRLTGTLG